jgi:SpoVK/Ycf46/Vps4 family AAA+-type ATPase
MPKEHKISNRESTVEDIDELSDQELMDPIWVGRKTGNIWKVTKVELAEGAKQVTYTKATGEVFTKPYEVFMGRMRLATPDDLWMQIKSTARADDGEATSELVTLITPDFRHDLDRMILYKECRTEIRIGLNRIQRKAEMEKEWALSQIEPKANRCILNFYGPPGTGKTLGAVAVAKILEMKLMKVDYAQIISKFVGDTAKHIQQAFKIAKESGAALMFDEADAMMSSRLGFNDSSDGAAVTSINQNRNVLLNEVDQFNGVVIMCTNFFSNYDEAFLRRIARHVEFKLPNVEMRKELFKLHLPKKDRVQLEDSEWDMIANKSDKFSGGDICNACVNGITRASMPLSVDEWELTYEDLEAEVKSIKNAKEQHANGNK